MNSNLGVVSEGGSLEGTVVMSVDDSAMKIAIGSDSGFLIVEPLRSNSLKIVRSHVTNSCGNLSSRNNPIQVGHLKGISIADVTNTLVLKEIVEVFVSSSEEFSLIKLHIEDNTS